MFITPDRQRVHALVEVVHTGYTEEGQRAYTANEPFKEEHKMTAEAHKAVYGNWPCINLLYLSPDKAKVDQYGRQKERASSVGHGASQGVPVGNCFLFPDEVT